jgi:hypothetical protein
MRYLMTITEQRVQFINYDTEPEVSYHDVFTGRKFDSIRDMALAIRDLLGHCELDCDELHPHSWLQSVNPKIEPRTGDHVYYHAHPRLTPDAWQELLFLLFTWELVHEWRQPLPNNVIPLRRRA